MINTNNCKIDFMNKEIRVTKNFYNAAQHFGTPEFETLMELQVKAPSFKIVFQNHSGNAKRMWYPTYCQMKDIVSLMTKEDEHALSELDDVIAMARATGKGYNMVRAWFCGRYREVIHTDHCEMMEYVPTIGQVNC